MQKPREGEEQGVGGGAGGGERKRRRVGKKDA